MPVALIYVAGLASNRHRLIGFKTLSLLAIDNTLHLVGL